MIIRTREHHIGLIGLSASGRTVFLTSLINHLKEHKPDRFRLESGGGIFGKGKQPVEISIFRDCHPDKGWIAFRYKDFRDGLSPPPKWPEKTKAQSQYVCMFKRSDQALSNVRLKFYDLPGERIADAVMTAKDYVEWSDYILTSVLRCDREHEECARDFLAMVQGGSVSVSELIPAYKQALGQIARRCQYYISPSTFLLNSKGDVNKRLDNAFPVGIDDNSEFVPLPEHLRRSSPEIAGKFARHYEFYRKQAVVPLFRALKSCHALIVFVDVITLLKTGLSAYLSNRQIFCDLLEVLQPGETVLGQFIRDALAAFMPAGWRPRRITRVAFVAPKLDLVHKVDRNQMVSLVRDMMEVPLRNYPRLSTAYFNCSAISSTEWLDQKDGRHWLCGELLFDSSGRKKHDRSKMKFPVAELPREWPDAWRQGEYVFPDVYPCMPQNRFSPPKQINLDKVLDFVMG